MARNEFGVESSDSGGFGAGVGNDFDDMFEEANSRSVVDDEVAAPETRRRRSNRQTEQAPVYSDAPLEEEQNLDFETPVEPELQYEPEPAPSLEAPSFGQTADVDFMFDEAESRAQVDDESYLENADIPEILNSLTGEDTQDVSSEDSFENFGSGSEDQNLEGFGSEGSYYDEPSVADDLDSWVDPAIASDFEDEQPQLSFGNYEPAQPEPTYEPEPSYDAEPQFEQSFEQAEDPEPVSYIEDAPSVFAPAVEEPAPAAVTYSPTVSEPRPSYEPQVPTVPVEVPRPAQVAEDGSVDYIERVILTSDAIRDLPENDAKAVNLFITAGQPVATHQELVLAALFADRQILKTAEAILEAKSKSSLDQAFFILALDDATFVDFGKILSHDLASTETVRFEGDRLQYARKLVDVVDSLPAESIARFEAVRSVLGAGELSS